MSKQKTRANESGQKKGRIRAKARADYRLKREAATAAPVISSPNQLTLPEQSSLCNADSSHNVAFIDLPETPELTICQESEVNSTLDVAFIAPKKKSFPFKHKRALFRVARRIRKAIPLQGFAFAQVFKSLTKNPLKEDEGYINSIKTPKKALETAVRDALTGINTRRSKTAKFTRRCLLGILDQAGMPQRSRGKANPAVKSSAIKSIIEDFYDEQAMDLPDKKAHRNGNHKKINTLPVLKLYRKFVTNHVKVSARSFFRHRPKNVQSVTKAKLYQCKCETCLNPKLKFGVLKTCVD